MSRHRYRKLNPDVKSAWDYFPINTKAVILGNTPSPHNTTSQTKQPFNKIKLRKALIHELLTDFEEDDDIISSDNNEDALDDHQDSTLLVNSATSKNIKPADIRSIMHVSSKLLNTKKKSTSSNA